MHHPNKVNSYYSNICKTIIVTVYKLYTNPFVISAWSLTKTGTLMLVSCYAKNVINQLNMTFDLFRQLEKFTFLITIYIYIYLSLYLYTILFSKHKTYSHLTQSNNYHFCIFVCLRVVSVTNFYLEYVSLFKCFFLFYIHHTLCLV